MTEEKRQKVALATMDAQTGAAALQPVGYEGAIELAKQLSESGMIPSDLQGKPKDILAVMMYGSEFNLPVMHSLQNIYVVKGRPSMSTNMMIGLILQSGLCEYFQCVETSDEAATYETKRKGDPKPTKLTFTHEQAQSAGFTNNPAWRTNRADMLRYRAASKLGRMVYPDVVSGVYTPQEMSDGFAEVDAELVPVDPEVPEEQPVVQQEGESKADAFLREKKSKQAAEEEDVVDAELVEEMDAEAAKEPVSPSTGDDGSTRGEPEDDDPLGGALDDESDGEDTSDEPTLSIEQVDEINAILDESHKGFGSEKKKEKRLRMFDETDEFLQKNPTLTAEAEEGYRNLHLVPAKHFDMVKAWATNVAQAIREED